MEDRFSSVARNFVLLALGLLTNLTLTFPALASSFDCENGCLRLTRSHPPVLAAGTVEPLITPEARTSRRLSRISPASFEQALELGLTGVLLSYGHSAERRVTPQEQCCCRAGDFTCEKTKV